MGRDIRALPMTSSRSMPNEFFLDQVRRPLYFCPRRLCTLLGSACMSVFSHQGCEVSLRSITLSQCGPAMLV